jgi:hypothetical protein
MLNKKILCLVLLFLLGMAHLQAQCLELEQKLNKRNLSEQIAEWNVALKPVTADFVEHYSRLERAITYRWTGCSFNN